MSFFSMMATKIPRSSQLPSRVTTTNAKPQWSNSVPSRGMATEQQLKRRLKSVGSIRKITKAMKMVAASKLKGVQSRLEIVRVFHKDIDAAWPYKRPETPPNKLLVCGMSSDRGLCGGVNSSIVKSVKSVVNAEQEKGRSVNMMLIGEKCKAALERLYKNNFVLTISESGKQKPVNFRESCLLGDLLNDVEYDEVAFVFNRFKSAIAFVTTSTFYPSLKLGKADREIFKDVDFDGIESNILANLYQYRLATQLYYMSFESATSEQSARMTAMENSSKSANEMLAALRLLYNRNRQSRITTELIEIISGATAAEEVIKKK